MGIPAAIITMEDAQMTWPEARGQRPTATISYLPRHRTFG
jgi:hypothetical protein